MLVRCEHCGSVLPDDATKCFACGNKHQSFVPPPIPEADSNELETLRTKCTRAEQVCKKVITWIVEISVTLLIIGGIIVDCGVGVIISIGVCIGTIAAIAWFFLPMWVYSKLNKKWREIQATQRFPEPDKAEYEQRIRDFVDQC